jgi:hypothetical protein
MNNYKSADMKRGVIILMVSLMLPVIRIAAQNPNFEKLNAFKIGFFTKRLNLTSQEAEKFWPVYNEYQRSKNLIQQEKIALIRNFNQNESILTDNQLTETGDKLIGCIAQESTLAVNFHSKLKKVLPPAKVIRYYQAENQYKAQLIKELQSVKQNQKPIQRP